MRAVIPAGGEGRRLRPLTDRRPKALLEVAGRPILEHGFERLLPFEPEELVVVVGWKGERIESRFGRSWRGVPIVYRRQDEPLGLAHAVRCATVGDAEPFLLMHGDVVFSAGANLMAVRERHEVGDVAATLLVERRPPDRVGRGAVQVAGNGRVLDLAEHPDQSQRRWGFVSAGFYVCGPGVAAATRAIPRSPRGEYEMPDAFRWLLERGESLAAVELRGSRVNVNTIEDRARAERLLREGAW